MEPHIQFATTGDGVHIAYAVSGSGPTLISVPSPPDNHVQLEWENPERQHSIEYFSAYRRLVRFDGRGTGLSDRDVSGFSLEARLRDLEAVVQRLEVDRLALMSGSHGNQLTIAYAARHPERVSHIIAINPFLQGRDFMSEEQLSMWGHMLTTDFRMFTDALGAQAFGWGKEEGPRFAEFFRACVEPGTALRIYEAMKQVDLEPAVAAVSCPVLVMRTQEKTMGSEAAVRRFVAALPQAHLVVIPGTTVEGATPEMIARIGAFFGEQWTPPAFENAQRQERERSQPEFRTVLFTDIESHTTMMQRLGDQRGREVLRIHERLTRAALERFAGTEVKGLGDGFMAAFRSTQRALDCAMELQRLISSHETGLPPDFRIRVGINAGEPIEEDGDLFGSAVIAANRLVGMAAGGEILVSNVVRELVSGKGHLFSDRGLCMLRGFDEPVRVWELMWRQPQPA